MTPQNAAARMRDAGDKATNQGIHEHHSTGAGWKAGEMLLAVPRLPREQHNPVSRQPDATPFRETIADAAMFERHIAATKDAGGSP